MNKVFLILVLLISSNSFSQSLRDSLFSGKLKADSAVVAKSKVNEQKIREDSVRRVQIDSLKKIGADTTQVTVNLTLPAKPELKYADNNKTWKKFVDEYKATITAEMQTSKKIRKGDYTVTLEYEIGTDGVVSAKNIICDPKSEALVDLIRDRMMPNAPQLAPQIVNGAPKKSSRRQILIFTKEKN
ncbi:MAG TPA: hypothetical protein VFP97_12585 [Chitinophagaceae bacterium]|nr:hypothetical protein [Chitinophagaceae bacterium]